MILKTRNSILGKENPNIQYRVSCLNLLGNASIHRLGCTCLFGPGTLGLLFYSDKTNLRQGTIVAFKHTLFFGPVRQFARVGEKRVGPAKCLLTLALSGRQIGGFNFFWRAGANPACDGRVIVISFAPVARSP